MKKKTKNITELLIFIVATELVGSLSEFLAGSRNIKEFYNELIKPPFSPPGWVFPVAWAVLYALMAGAAWLVWKCRHEDRDTALGLYFVQLAVNCLWTPVFFRLRSLTGAVAVILLLTVIVTAMTLLFRKIDQRTTPLLIPYLAWLVYASYLTVGFRLLN